ncbi:RsmB/NOP family class I SAM-dependent RNA methyltransferase [Candidatus Acidianus copahuensis]|uniref:RsmB/NOP family class I SAM-dependent RNA methyltransferase n=1 Tax=Candidatus Acidianus copahuensis TaxID=1160895 RepID=UPI0006933326|nr:RsmB/NOP family class I SAM-dependent RNA methyltransferase [Candidatus Acidianus copahuensis]
MSNGVRPLLPNWAREELVNYLDVSSLEKSFVNNTKWIRINTLKADVDKVILGLEKLGIMIEQDNDIYYMAKVLSGNIKATEYYRNFSIIFQDKASSAVVEALKPENGDLIFDVSSSPGIKASQISAITENKVTLVLADMDRRRLHKEIELLRKLGVNMERINIINQDSSSNSVISADKVLFDAPCSSSGIIANEPSILLKLEKSRILSFSQLQQSILDNIYKVKADYIIYSVCSIFPEEGEIIFENLVNSLEKPLNFGSHGYTQFKSGSLSVRFFPHENKTEGFFITKINIDRI